ncbi:MAG TPA: DUF1772 domain-containing protein [Acidobacteriaceae bacterium]|jgi:uncharacterized membrane protein|nr:DUF1772 domain-containing protein [Acidobacteriaceae bacterium]
MTSFLDIATILIIGLMIGVEFAVSAFINPILSRLDDRAHLAAVRLFAARLGFAMPFWYSLGLLLLIAETILLRHQRQFPLLLTAVALWIAVIVLTLIFLVPINNRMAQLSPDVPAREAFREHGKWDAMHRVRVAVLIAAMVLFLVAIHA